MVEGWLPSGVRGRRRCFVVVSQDGVRKTLPNRELSPKKPLREEPSFLHLYALTKGAGRGSKSNQHMHLGLVPDGIQLSPQGPRD